MLSLIYKKNSGFSTMIADAQLENNNRKDDEVFSWSCMNFTISLIHGVRLMLWFYNYTEKKEKPNDKAIFILSIKINKKI